MLLSPSLVQHINTEHTKVNGVKTDCSFSFNLHQFSFSIHFSIGTGLVSEEHFPLSASLS